MMKRVLIVDDEPWVAYGLAHLIDWESLGFTVIGEAHNGLTALEMIIDQQPELIISDIRMPGLDGIQLLERIKQMKLETKAILVSGYSDFEYAQNAIRLGAFDYLLKQVDKDQLTDTLLRLTEHWQKERQSSRELDLFLDDLFDLLEPDNNIKIANFLSNKGIQSEYPHFRFISCLYSQATASFANDWNIEDEGVKLIRFRTGQNKLSILVNYDEGKNPLALLNYISDNLSDGEYAGISSIGLFSTPIAKLYQESDMAMLSSFFYRGIPIREYKPAAQAANVGKDILLIELAIKEQDREQFNLLLDRLCEQCKTQNLFVDQISAIYNQIVSVFYKYYSSSAGIGDLEHLSYDQIVRSCSSVEQLFDRMKSFIEQLTPEEVQISNEQVKKIIDYIDVSYTEDIMLSTLSKEFNISLGYLSALIKKGTGTTYTEYVVNKRLSLAKELLHDSSLSIQDIVQRIGYKDYFHFNKLFKKHYGITPSKYRKI